ncbi:alpha/beta hydrolase [Anaeromyxobacter sp. SG26]|uniref:alpha/beta hydrolase n=1 Tax=Anaeromyxobacter sp. SG26 TaxID=2925407 RepID=UPI001F58DE7E|nr:alpha/beta fold hydrolase [Anaeromyxobacter sp. SG26]
MTERVGRSIERRSGAVRVALLALAALTVQCAGAAVRPPPKDLDAEPVAFPSASGSDIHGWFVRGRPRAGAVVLLHGMGANRLTMVDRARFLSAAGYSVLLIDFRAHGESPGEESTYGALESRDARAAVEFVRSALPGERVGVIGISMGGAAALLGETPLPVEALVLESVYPTIRDAVRDRLRAWLGPIGPPLTSLVLHSIFPRDGVRAADLRPIDRISEQTAPVLVAAGTADRYTTPSESRALFERARSPKELWEVDRAAHVDLHAFAPAEYERRVGAFLARHLREAGMAASRLAGAHGG